jgi:hypothetical protein
MALYPLTFLASSAVRASWMVVVEREREAKPLCRAALRARGVATRLKNMVKGIKLALIKKVEMMFAFLFLTGTSFPSSFLLPAFPFSSPVRGVSSSQGWSGAGFLFLDSFD